LHLSETVEIGWKALEKFVDQVFKISPQPAFIINGGDNIFASMDLSTPFEKAKKQMARYKEIISKLQIPVYHIVGNHDMVNPGQSNTEGLFGKELFEEMFGPRYQSFDWKQYHIVLLDTWKCIKENISNHHVGADIDYEQLEWLKKDLEQCESDQTVIIVDHHHVHDLPGEPGSKHRILSVNVYEKLKKYLRSDLNYIELSGCDHQNSIWQRDNWKTFTTASFCGAWWNGNPCIDTNKGGYAIIVDRGDRLEHYYKEMDSPLAVAEPRADQTYKNNLTIKAIDPFTGEELYDSIYIKSEKAGFEKITLKINTKEQEILVFIEPKINRNGNYDISGKFSFELVESITEYIDIICNKKKIEQLPVSIKIKQKISIPIKNLSPTWNEVEMKGNALIQNPELKVGEKTYIDPRICRLLDVRKNTPCETHIPEWDTSLLKPATPWQYPMSKFYFYLKE